MTRKRIALTTAFFLAFSASACASDSPDNIYCTDSSGAVVDNDYCDGTHGGGFFIVNTGHTTYGRGQVIPRSSYSWVSSTDSAGRARIGAPSTGKIGSSGGFGTSGAKGGGTGS